MALQSGSFIRDENRNVHYNGPSFAKTNALNSHGKCGPSGRKPLSDLSNARNPVLNQSSKLQTSKNFTLIGDGKKKSIVKGSERVQNGARKVLSDISNSGKPNLQEASKKKQNLKLSTVKQKPLHHSAIYEEGFLHNHQECIKAQNSALDMDQFLRIVGLDVPKKLTSTKKPNSPSKHLELNEMDEPPFVYQSPKKLRLDSPPCKSPKSPSLDFFSLRKDNDSINLTLKKTP